MTSPDVVTVVTFKRKLAKLFIIKGTQCNAMLLIAM